MKKRSKFYRLKKFLLNREIPSLWIEGLNIFKDSQFTFFFLLGMVPVFHHYDVGYCFPTFMMFRKYSIPRFLKI